MPPKIIFSWSSRLLWRDSSKWSIRSEDNFQTLLKERSCRGLKIRNTRLFLTPNYFFLRLKSKSNYQNDALELSKKIYKSWGHQRSSEVNNPKKGQITSFIQILWSIYHVYYIKISRFCRQMKKYHWLTVKKRFYKLRLSQNLPRMHPTVTAKTANAALIITFLIGSTIIANLKFTKNP